MLAMLNAMRAGEVKSKKTYTVEQRKAFVDQWLIEKRTKGTTAKAFENTNGIPENRISRWRREIYGKFNKHVINYNHGKRAKVL